MFLFHHINSYEDGGCVIMDVVAYRDSTILHKLELDNLRSGIFPNSLERPQVWRFILPLDIHQVREAGNSLIYDIAISLRFDRSNHVTCSKSR